MTIPELFEQRFGKLVRWLAGVVIVLGGLLNMGVFLRVGGQFLVVCCGMDLSYLELAMTVLLVGVAVYTILGGMLSVLVTDFLQFVVMSAGLIVVTFLCWRRSAGTRWSPPWKRTMARAASIRSSTGVRAGPFVLSNLLTNTAAVLTWQTCIARLLAAKDSKTGRKVYTRHGFLLRLPLGHSRHLGHRGAGDDRARRWSTRSACSSARRTARSSPCRIS